ncbi:hypothetical protein TRVL_03206 [Trypanosoma vivax]|uniref:Uncharacterized protein n=1 Tax=Trypanosoma vivax (strain Y486) TaxID=1055687 RepID=G0U682_TRYVY|nr:hypothetical protein TRVL_03206 [Trypanosoma vivax]CCC51385.1 hypothetical protein TVY486_1004360 [Trypanosoma vivax Y486]
MYAMPDVAIRRRSDKRSFNVWKRAMCFLPIYIFTAFPYVPRGGWRGAGECHLGNNVSMCWRRCISTRHCCCVTKSVLWQVSQVVRPVSGSIASWLKQLTLV